MPEIKRTLVIGASPNPSRFSYKAVKMLKEYGIPVFAVGLRQGEISGVKIEKPFPPLSDIHTITLYVGAKNQPFYYDFIIKVKPKRVIINPGADNIELESLLLVNGIEVIRDCTLLMLGGGSY
jgi:predicted CoA-binding protein